MSRLYKLAYNRETVRYYRIIRGMLHSWWYIVPGKTVLIPAVYNFNDEYRPWLESHVGKQYVDWDWRTAPNDLSKIEVKVRNNKVSVLSLISLKWS